MARHGSRFSEAGDMYHRAESTTLRPARRMERTSTELASGVFPCEGPPCGSRRLVERTSVGDNGVGRSEALRLVLGALAIVAFPCAGILCEFGVIAEPAYVVVAVVSLATFAITLRWADSTPISGPATSPSLQATSRARLASWAPDLFRQSRPIRAFGRFPPAPSAPRH